MKREPVLSTRTCQFRNHRGFKMLVGLTEQRATSSKVRAAEEAILAVVDAIFLASGIPGSENPRNKALKYPAGSIGEAFL